MMRGGDDELDRKSSTTSNMFIGSTISKPNVESIINAVATILHSQMLEVHPIPIIIIRMRHKVNKFQLKVIYSFSLRKNTYLRNQRHSISRELLC